MSSRQKKQPEKPKKHMEAVKSEVKKQKIPPSTARKIYGSKRYEDKLSGKKPSKVPKQQRDLLAEKIIKDQKEIEKLEKELLQPQTQQVAPESPVIKIESSPERKEEGTESEQERKLAKELGLTSSSEEEYDTDVEELLDEAEEEFQKSKAQDKKFFKKYGKHIGDIEAEEEGNFDPFFNPTEFKTRPGRVTISHQGKPVYTTQVRSQADIDREHQERAAREAQLHRQLEEEQEAERLNNLIQITERPQTPPRQPTPPPYQPAPWEDIGHLTRPVPPARQPPVIHQARIQNIPAPVPQVAQPENIPAPVPQVAQPVNLPQPQRAQVQRIRQAAPQQAVQLAQEDINRIRLDALRRRGVEREEQPREQPQQEQRREEPREDQDRQLREIRDQREQLKLERERMDRLRKQTKVSTGQPYAYPRPYSYDPTQKFGTKKEYSASQQEELSAFRILLITQNSYIQDDSHADIHLARTKGMLGYQISKNSGPIQEIPIRTNILEDFIVAIRSETNNTDNLVFKVGIDSRYNVNVGDLHEGKYIINPNLQDIARDYHREKLITKDDYSTIEKILKKKQYNQNDYDDINNVFHQYKKLKWTPKEIRAGRKEVKGLSFNLMDALSSTGYLKIKHLVNQNNIIRLMNKYYFLAEIKNDIAYNYFDDGDLEVSEKFKRQINKFLFSDYNFDVYKATRRMFYYSKFQYYKFGNETGKDNMEKLHRLFTSNIKDIFEAYDRVKALIKTKASRVITKATLEYIKEELTIDNINIAISGNLTKLCEKLKEVLDEESKEFLETNHFIPLSDFFIPQLVKYI